MRAARLAAVNVAVALALFFSIDIVLSNTGILYGLIPDSFRIRDRHLHHNLAPGVAGRSTWGSSTVPFFTNALGFRDDRVRGVEKRGDRSRVLFIGDSFTEGVGLPWGETFVGRFAAAFPQVEVLNAGVSSYSMSMYWKKVAAFLEAGYAVDHVVIYIDISDVQDEVIYAFDGAGDIVDSDIQVYRAARVGDRRYEQHRVAVPRGRWQTIGKAVGAFLAPNFLVTRYVAERFKNDRFGLVAHAAVQRPGLTVPDGALPPLVSAYWTVEDLPEGYGPLGVEGALSKGLREMDELAALLRARGIGFSVGVYPWIDTLVYDKIDSRQVTVWRDWCRRNGCERFIDHFPDLFAEKTRPDWQHRLYIDGDVHFNEAGNRLIAARLIEVMRDVVPSHDVVPPSDAVPPHDVVPPRE